jgi:hypothetical protein
MANFRIEEGITFSDSTVQSTAWTGGRVVTVPTTSQGASGNLQGDIAFSSTHIYYCTQTYGAPVWDYSAPIDISGGDGVSNGLAITLATPPQVGWKISNGTTVATVSSVTPQATWYIIFYSPAITFATGATIYYAATEPATVNIWKRVAWSGDTW